MSSIFAGFMEFISRDRELVKSHGQLVCSCLLSHWSQLSEWWEGGMGSSGRLAAVSLLKKMLVVDLKVCSSFQYIHAFQYHLYCSLKSF